MTRAHAKVFLKVRFLDFLTCFLLGPTRGRLFTSFLSSFIPFFFSLFSSLLAAVFRTLIGSPPLAPSIYRRKGCEGEKKMQRETKKKKMEIPLLLVGGEREKKREERERERNQLSVRLISVCTCAGSGSPVRLCPARLQPASRLSSIN